VYIQSGAEVHTRGYTASREFCATLCIATVQASISIEDEMFAVIYTGCNDRPASYTMGTGIFPGYKRQERGIYPTPCSAEVKEKVELYLHPLPQRLFHGKFSLHRVCLHTHCHVRCV
jgi:hypothetical protein